MRENQQSERVKSLTRYFEGMYADLDEDKGGKLCYFDQAKAVIEELERENKELKSQLKDWISRHINKGTQSTASTETIIDQCQIQFLAMREERDQLTAIAEKMAEALTRNDEYEPVLDEWNEFKKDK